MRHSKTSQYIGTIFSRQRRLFLPFLFILPLVASCGGGGDLNLAGGGIGGSGYTSVGTVTALGSIFVNGVEFQTTGAAVTLSGSAANERDLRIGMVVKVEGTVNPDGRSGKADAVSFDPNVAGPVGSVDPGRNTLVVMGQTVLVDARTIFAGLPGNAAGLSGIAANEPVEISGLTDADGTIRATSVSGRRIGYPSEVTGRVSNLASATLRINDLTVDFSRLGPLAIQGGDCITVRGNLASSATLFADFIEKKTLGHGEISGIEIEGLVTGLAYSGMGMGGFAIFTPYGHQRVEFSPSTGCSGGRLDAIRAGMRLKVQGTMRNGTIQARQLAIM